MFALDVLMPKARPNKPDLLILVNTYLAPHKYGKWYKKIGNIVLNPNLRVSLLSSHLQLTSHRLCAKKKKN
jgi:hypothetical protein